MNKIADGGCFRGNVHCWSPEGVSPEGVSKSKDGEQDI